MATGRASTISDVWTLYLFCYLSEAFSPIAGCLPQAFLILSVVDCGVGWLSNGKIGFFSFIIGLALYLLRFGYSK
jgi:hypothetical protein